ncbi:MAG TPA: formate dehydrogenase accessory sulfurtransferase FdhD [Dehalococcoidia bacterium]|nr:formate dehydrogenase accessory sulfurtransferase FdhD [Dehalococcoidia bacterium]
MALAAVRSQVRQQVRRLRDGVWSRADDVLAAEEPLEIRLVWQDGTEIARKAIAITMRTPGDDFELAAGFLHGEGIVRRQEDVIDVSYCTDEDEEQTMNIVNVTLRPGLEFDVSRLERNFYTTSSCGVCGKAALDTLEVQGCAVLNDSTCVRASIICALPEKLRAAQAVFERTGGLHAAGLFTPDGELRLLREDVGRHNALDKLVGERFLAAQTPLDGHVLLLSGRASFELLQKALVARIPLVAAVGAPSSLAVELAQSFNITLAGFVRPDSLNVYAGEERILS